jgi:DNA-binding transcriptional regulator LsrR (DeoR family)
MKLNPVTVAPDPLPPPAPDDREQLRRSDDAVLFRAAQLFLGERSGGLSPSDIARQISREFNLRPELSREAIYPMLGEAVRRGFLRLVPPVERELTERVRAQYPNLKASTLAVVQTAGQHDNAKVATVAAELALAHLQDIVQATHDPTVSVGLGPGRATLDFCRAFSGLLAGYPEPLKLRLVAISAGCPANAPEYSSISFFNLFPKRLVEGRTVGLFAETLVPQDAFDQIKQRPGVKEAFAEQKGINLVVTSMGDVRDEHDLLTMFLRQSPSGTGRPRTEKWVGNVQYRPYTAAGPVVERGKELRAVTLFELKDLVQAAGEKNRHVILMARQCGICGRSRAQALRPLLTNPALKVFSTLVLDAATARDLLK